MKHGPPLGVPAVSFFLAAVFAGSASAQVAGDLLPDMVVDPDALTNTRIDSQTLSGRRLLRLTTSTPNIGEGALEIRGSTIVADDRQEVLQRIYRTDGSFWDRTAGTFVYHPTHMHTHFDDWAVYRLRSVLADGSPGPVVAQGEKTSFCLIDILPYQDAADAPHYTTCGQMVQGISPGWADVYDRELDGQWIDVTDLPNGSYWLEAEVDPEQRIVEVPGGKGNNVARVRMVLGEDSSTVAPPPRVVSDTPNRPPTLEVLAPAGEVTWVEHAYEGLHVQWAAADPDGDDLKVSLFIDEDGVTDAGTQPLGGYQNMPADAGQAVINTAAVEPGTWYLFVVVSDGVVNRGTWVSGSVVVYTKGDLDFDGHTDREDWVQLVQRRRSLKGLPLSSVVAGWEQQLDFDRNGTVDEHDIDLFRSTALSVSANHIEH